MGDEVASDEPRDEDRQSSGSAQDEAIARLRVELESALSEGKIPNGWMHKVYLTSPDRTRFKPSWAFSAVGVVGCLLAGWLIWGWNAGLGCGLVALGLSLILSSFRGGPRVGEAITHTFTPPKETLFQLGIADHELLSYTRNWGELFSYTDVASPRDRRGARLVLLIGGASVGIYGSVVLLIQFEVIPIATALHVFGVAYLILSCCFAVWYWRSSASVPAATGSEPRREKGSVVDDVLDSATTGESPVKTIGASLFQQLPRRVGRPAYTIWILLSGVMTLLVSFAIAPSATGLLAPIAAAASLVAFILGGVRNLAAVGVGLIRRDRRLLLSGLVGIALMGALLLIAKLFGWLDEWQAVLAWITGSNRSG